MMYARTRTSTHSSKHAALYLFVAWLVDAAPLSETAWWSLAFQAVSTGSCILNSSQISELPTRVGLFLLSS
jgi:hypothetical protein